MSSPLVWKVFDGKSHVGSTLYAEDAAALVALRPTLRLTIKYAHCLVVWQEGVDGAAGESFDHVAQVALARVAEYQQRKFNEAHAHKSKGELR